MKRKASFDPVTIEIIQSSLDAISSEMFATMRKTAMSSIIYEVLDFGVAITDRERRLASSGADMPAFVRMLDYWVRAVGDGHHHGQHPHAGDGTWRSLGRRCLDEGGREAYPGARSQVRREHGYPRHRALPRLRRNHLSSGAQNTAEGNVRGARPARRRPAAQGHSDDQRRGIHRRYEGQSGTGYRSLQLLLCFHGG